MRRMWWIAGGLLLLLVALGGLLRWLSLSPRFVSDEQLLAELAAIDLTEPALPPANDWPQWRGPTREGTVAAQTLRTEWADLKPRWKQPGGEGYSSFALRDGLAWTMLQRDDQEEILCLDRATGEPIWRHRYSPEKNFDYGGPRATPTLDGDDLFTVSSDGRVMRLSASKGDVIWEVPLGLPAPRWGFAASPLVRGEQVFAAGVAFDRETGSRLWGLSDAAGYSSPVTLTLGTETQVLFFTGTHLVGVRGDDGAERWRIHWPTFSQVNAATPVVIPAGKADGTIVYVFISSGYGKGSALIRVTRERDRPTARVVYQTTELGCHFASPVRVGDYLYGLDEERDLTCLEIRTGQVQWRQRGFQKGSLIRIGDRLLILGENGNLAMVKANPEEYEEIAKTRPFRDRCWASPAFANGQLLLRDRRNMVLYDLTP
jgi:outer membrane protein assembly factor BamB